ncbi:8222_t:CDS:2 [Ambispora gerdemannii]|uniref:8222_t:CDS:1 n=1 Tax=Ambispora gerdemannii TaxID=144530 RepID=A0A9N9G7J0_9GLOM|nr:8222_t:CDS:2 [Ambispora gerdemannii]
MGETPSAKNRPIVIAVKLYARVLAERLFKVGAIIGSMARIILIEKKHKTKRTKKIAGKATNLLLSKGLNGLISNPILPISIGTEDFLSFLTSAISISFSFEEESGETLTVPKFLSNQGMDPNTLIKTKKKAKNKTNFLLQLKVGIFSDLTSLTGRTIVRNKTPSVPVNSYFQSLPLSYHLKDKSLRKKCQIPWLARGEPTKDKNEEIRQPIRNLKPKGKQQQKAKAMIDKPFPSNERVVLVDSHIAGKTSVIPIGFLAIAGNHEATINATKTSR